MAVVTDGPETGDTAAAWLDALEAAAPNAVAAPIAPMMTAERSSTRLLFTLTRVPDIAVKMMAKSEVP